MATDRRYRRKDNKGKTIQDTAPGSRNSCDVYSSNCIWGFQCHCQ